MTPLRSHRELVISPGGPLPTVPELIALSEALPPTRVDVRGVKRYTFVGCHLIHGSPLQRLASALVVLLPRDGNYPLIDGFFVSYGVGDFTSPHVDFRSGSRASLLLVAPLSGGDWTCEGGGPIEPACAPLSVPGYLWRPAQQKHSVSPVTEGRRLVFTVGRVKGPHPRED